MDDTVRRAIAHQELCVLARVEFAGNGLLKGRWEAQIVHIHMREGISGGSVVDVAHHEVSAPMQSISVGIAVFVLI